MQRVIKVSDVIHRLIKIEAAKQNKTIGETVETIIKKHFEKGEK